jgi:hypothetical protein
MLLNLSNHPSSEWQEEQISSAIETYHSIRDIPFPNVPPDANENFIQELADRYCEKCLQILSESTDTNNAVHLMGEMTFTFALVGKLQNKGAKCIASTTTRKAEQLAQNEKVVTFKFIRFREYLSYY